MENSNLFFMPKEKSFGTIKLITTYVYYDKPVCFKCSINNKGLFFVLAVNEDDTGEEWFYVPTTAKELDKLEKKQVSIKSFIINNSKRWLYKIKVFYNKELDDKIEKINLDKTIIDDNLLPKDDIYLKYKAETKNSHNNKKLHLHAV